MTVGCIVHELDDRERQAAYRCDVTYGTNNEFGFDYLRDNMKFRLEDMVPPAVHLCHCRRGRLDPDRRGAHAADHLRSGRGFVGALYPHRQADPDAGRGGLREGRKAAHRRADRSRRRKDGGIAARERAHRNRHALRHPQRLAGAPRQPGAARAQAVRPRHRIHRQGRQDRHHRRIHRPHDGRAALFRGAAPGARSQGST